MNENKPDKPYDTPHEWLAVRRAQFELGKRINEVIEREFDWDVGALSDIEWNGLFEGIISETEGGATDVDRWACRLFAKMASAWADNDYYGVERARIEEWNID